MSDELNRNSRTSEPAEGQESTEGIVERNSATPEEGAEDDFEGHRMMERLTDRVTDRLTDRTTD